MQSETSRGSPSSAGKTSKCRSAISFNPLMITNAYEDLLTLDEVIDQELILFVSLNTNKNAKAVTALGRMLLQNLQLIVGQRYQNEQERRREGRPMVSVILDEFAPFAYANL